MTTPITNPRPVRQHFLTAAAVGLSLAALAVAAPTSAKNRNADGVRAAVNHGTLNVTGSDGGQQVALRLKANDPRTIQVDAGDNGSADFSFASDDVSAIKVKLGDGNDLARIDDSNGSFTGDSRPTTIAGGGGNDTLLGAQNPPAGPAANQVETYKGGDGNDTVDGGRGNDIADLGAGNDTFRWDPGEGSDVIEGQDGADTMLFNGAGNAANPVVDTVTMSANGGRLTFFRQPAAVTMDTNDVEVVDFNALAGADTVLVDDLTGTDVTRTDLDLGGIDGAVDSVDVNGTNGVDNISVQGNGSGADVTGLATADSVKNAEPTDHLNVHTLAGADNVAGNTGGLIQLLVD
jgi:RTX calcium-binding nonapeptide repeat (4 copies)